MNDLVYAVLIAGFLSASSQVQTAVLDNAEVATLLAVLASVGAKQRHLLAAACQRSEAQKGGTVFYLDRLRRTAVDSNENSPAQSPKVPVKCESQVNRTNESRTSRVLGVKTPDAAARVKP